MFIRRIVFSFATLLAMFAASAAVAETAPKDATLKIACEGALGRGSSHAMPVKTFGGENVKYGKIEIADNTAGIFVSIVFPNDAKRRLEVFWENDPNRTCETRSLNKKPRTMPGL